MKNLRSLVIAAACISMLSGCSVASDIGNLFTSGSAAQANTVAAAEGFYTAADKALDGAVTQKAITVTEAQSLGVVDDKVYAALVTVRNAAESGDSATIAAAIAAFNAVNEPFLSQLEADGITVALPVQTGGTS